MENFFNLYEFMKTLNNFAEFGDTNIIARVHTFDFTFACHLDGHKQNNNQVGDELVQHQHQQPQELVFGTGGKLLQSLRDLMKNLVGKIINFLRLFDFYKIIIKVFNLN